MEMGGETIFKEGRFDLDGEKEDRLSSYIKDCQFSSTSEHPEHDKEVSIIIDFNAGKGNGRVWGSDLTKEYVAVNAEYRS
mmetsp:Transcript_15892/g.32647  ORF Transcript_15892/g.32647 Transcript_15892/m.32647 type:complete len:80 (+) Transcript_15892:337-576(+)